jgi:hypothetical protein
MFPNSYRPFKHSDKKAQLHIPHYELRNLKKKGARLGQISSFGVVRNPWDFYVSLYHFEKEKADDKWAGRSIYNQLERPKTFNEFLKNIFDKNAYDGMRGEGHLTLFKRMKDLDIGVLSARYLNLFFDKNIFNYNIDYIKENSSKLLSINYIIKNESLILQLYKILKNNKFKHHSLKTIDDFDQYIKNNKVKNNKSTHKHYSEYYTKDLVDLVREKERIIIYNHNYKF